MNIYSKIANNLNIRPYQVENIKALLDEGATIPFIARYRKEKTGSLDEVEIGLVKEKLDYFETLEKRKVYILETIEKAGQLSAELKGKIIRSSDLNEIEDIFLPFKPKRRTKASIAREKGLLPFAELILGSEKNINLKSEALKFVDGEKINSGYEAIEGAGHIIAEIISEDFELRKKIREIFAGKSYLRSKVVKKKEEEALNFKDYFSFEEKITKCPGHRVLAVFRGADLGLLSVSLCPDTDESLFEIRRRFLKNNSVREFMENVIQDAYKRLILPSMENELKKEIKKKADLEAIEVFSSNLENLLLSPPLGAKRMLAVDPGIRTGCKVVALDEKGDLKDYFTIFPFDPKRIEDSLKAVKKATDKYRPEVIAMGNGTGGRETRDFFVENFPSIPSIMVDEKGASVYSASKAARDEFQDLDIVYKGAVSIGRRLMDPLSELVKIDPKSIGVGQYQHDVDQKLLKEKLDTVVEFCVNRVGANLNTAGVELLSYISGLGPKSAASIIEFRKKNERFDKIEDLKKVAGIGEKTFKLCSGFLRIYNGENPLDATGIHPESYHLVLKMGRDLGESLSSLIKDKSIQKKIDIKKYITEDTNIPTLKDIISELEKPGRDPRPPFEIFSFSDVVKTIDDLEEGMILPGIVTNVTKFGAFVDMGIHIDGLVHISEIADEFVKDPSEKLKVNDHLKVRVISIDRNRKRIGLSLRKPG